MRSFVLDLHLPRVMFGATLSEALPAELARLGLKRALLLCTPEQSEAAERVGALIGDRLAGLHPRAVMHVPVEVAQAAVEDAQRVGADCALAFGGGSTIGLGKAIALQTGLPVIAVPTTFAGSEMTPIYGLTGAGRKTTGRDARVLPRAVIYDPALTRSLPAALCRLSGINAIAHAAEGLYAHDGNPITALMAEDGIRAMARALARLQEDPGDAAAHGEAQYGACLCGAVLGNVSMGLHHKLCHTLGGIANLPHAETHAVMLAHTLAYNATAAPDAMARLARALGTQEAIEGIRALCAMPGVPVSLAALGLPAAQLDEAAELAAASPYPNPRPLERVPLRALLQRAYEGAPPTP